MMTYTVIAANKYNHKLMGDFNTSTGDQHDCNIIYAEKDTGEEAT